MGLRRLLRSVLNTRPPFERRFELRRHETRHGVYYLPNLKSDCVANAIRRGEIFEEQIVNVAERYIKKGSCVLDLGANFGQMTLLFSKLVGDSGQVFALEADEFVYGVLAKNIEANGLRNVTALCRAIHERNDELVFYPEPDFKRFGAFGSYGIRPTAKSGRSVRTITVDSLDFPSAVSFMKVDVQGCDLLALRGARNTIKKHRMPLVFEYEEQFQEEFGTCFEDYVDFIESVNYKLKDVIYGINYLAVPR